MILEDKVLINPSEDQLGRTNLIRVLTDSIKAIVQRDHGPMTFGILGAWGEGKTSFMRMVQTSLYNEGLKTIWYNPWEVSDEKRMALDFFSLLADQAFNDQAVSVALKSYGRAFLSQGDSHLLTPVLSDSVARLSRCIPFFPKDFEAAKQAISKELQDTNKHLVVFIDDIDRLDESEVHIIFKLIRQIADFDNVVYVIGLDSDAVSSVLASRIDNNKDTGRTYLSKIIQTPLVLPPVKEGTLKRILTDLLRSTLGENHIYYEEVDLERVATVVASLLKTKRDIIRYINQINLVLPVLRLETEWSDLFIIELLKFINEQAWTNIYQNKDKLLFLGPSLKEQDREKEYADYVSQQILEFPPQKQPIIERILKQHLFPKHSVNPASRAINNQVYFAQYFVCGIPEDIIAHEEVLVLKKRVEGADENGIIAWLNANAKQFSHDEVDRASRTVLALIQKEKKSTEKATLTLCRALAMSDLTERYTFYAVGNPNAIDLTISSVFIPRYLGGRDEKGNMIVNREYESKLLKEIYEKAPLNFAVNVLQGVESPGGVKPADEYGTFEVLKKRLIHKDFLYPFNYSNVLLGAFLRTWKRLNDTEYYDYLKEVLESPKFDAGKMIVEWLTAVGPNDVKKSEAVNHLSDLFYAIPGAFRKNVERSGYKENELVHFFVFNSSLFPKQISE